MEQILQNEGSSYSDLAQVCWQIRTTVVVNGVGNSSSSSSSSTTTTTHPDHSTTVGGGHSKISGPVPSTMNASSSSNSNNNNSSNTGSNSSTAMLRLLRLLCDYAQHRSSLSSSTIPEPSTSSYHTSPVVDRPGRTLVLNTIATIARTLYAMIRPSPLLYSFYETLSHQYEDEIASDVPAILCHLALDDPDEGMSAACLSTLGHLICTGPSTTYGGLYDDALQVHVRHLTAGGTSPYAPTLRSIGDEDVGIPLQELSTRIIENTMAPRLLHLVDRVTRYQQSRHICMALPCISMCLVHLLDVYPTTIHNTDRTVHSKRWSELDVAGLIDVGITSIILPILYRPSSTSSSIVAITAALSGLRLAHALPQQHWVRPVCWHGIQILQEEYASNDVAPIETKLSLLAVILVAARALPLYPDRATLLIWFAEQLCHPTLPSTISTPVPCAGLRLTNHTGMSAFPNVTTMYRRPTRVALWTELALSIFLDGPSYSTDQRQACLQAFLNSATIQRILTVSSSDEATVPWQQQVLRDEILVAFTNVAIDAGRRLRVAADGSTPLAAPNLLQCDHVPEWLALTNVVLTCFAECALVPVVAVGTSSAYLDETLTLLNAGLASYVQLLQEYLHFAGLLYPSTSVALKLGANACPPHLLWDRLTESASFLSHLEPAMIESDNSNDAMIKITSKLMNELVSRETKFGIPSHHMRLFVLALASDQWVQCRISAIRQQQFESMNGTELQSSQMSEALDSLNGREILMALAPKRLLLKIVNAHVPPVGGDGKPKRDPMKKLAMESTKVCVACIENIALLACDWRRRYGSSFESKHLVSIAVGLLQGKMDESPIDDSMKSIVGPICDAAVSRIQSFYENSGANDTSLDSFPLSELVMQPVKIKIKPLISASKLNVRTKDEILQEYMMQLCRQIVASRIQLSLFSTPNAADSLLSTARPRNWLRLAVPPVPPSRDGRIYGSHGPTMAAWDHSVTAASAASDPIQLIVAYTVRRYLRYDGEDDYQITALVRAFNMTPIDIADGIRLEISIVNTSADSDSHDNETLTHAEALGGSVRELETEIPLSCIAIDYPNELKSGEFITWEVTLNDIILSNSLLMIPSVVFLNVPVEPDVEGMKIVGTSDGETSTVNKDSKSGEDDFQVTSSDVAAANAFQGETTNIRLVGEPLTLPPLIVCQPCPLVFFTDRRGDINSFRFLWFRFPYQLSPIKLALNRSNNDGNNINPITQKVAEMSSLEWEGEAIPGGVASRLWAFFSFSGARLYCILTESDGPNTDVQRTLYIRGDDQQLLFSFIGSKQSRQSVVSSLLPNMILIE